jgi:hypothetical protein
VGLDPSAPNGRPTTDGGEAAPAALAKIAEKASDLEAIKKAVDDAAAITGGVWLSYLFALFYFALAAGAVTHIDLFFEKPVRLPFLGIDLPLLPFFVVAPALILIVHAYTLTHLVLLADRAKALNRALGHETGASQDDQRRRISTSVLVQYLTGPSDIRSKRFGGALGLIAWSTVVLAPTLVLLVLQLQFLPYHDSGVTYWHRFALLLISLSFGGCGAKCAGGARRRSIASRARSRVSG